MSGLTTHGHQQRDFTAALNLIIIQIYTHTYIHTQTDRLLVNQNVRETKKTAEKKERLVEV